MKKNLITGVGLFIFLMSGVYCSESSNPEDQGATYEQAKKTYTEAITADGSLCVMTYNILWDKETTGETQWSYRREGLVNLLKRHHPDVIGVQEGFLNQVEYIKNELGYQYFGFGTDDGKPESGDPNRYESLNPIVYNPSRLTLLDKGVFWYSDDPDSPNLGYCAGTSDTHYRNCVWGKFSQKDKIIYLFNTHFALADDIREKQAKLLMSKIREIAGEGALTIITGDFNADPKRDHSYSVLTDSSLPMHLTDSKNKCTAPLAGPSFTGNGLTVGSRTSGYEVDHIFMRNINSCSAHKIIDDYERAWYPSDHFPVLAVLSF